MILKKTVWMMGLCSLPYMASAGELAANLGSDAWVEEQRWRHPEIRKDQARDLWIEWPDNTEVTHRGDARVPIVIKPRVLGSSRDVVRVEVDQGFISTSDMPAQLQHVAVDIASYGQEASTVYIHPPQEAGTTLVRIILPDGRIQERHIRWLPELRPWIAVGGVDVVIGQHKMSRGELLPLIEEDDFEEVWDANFRRKDKHYYAGRAMFFIRGEFLKDYLLTASLDTSRRSSLERRTFDRIDEDKLYPIYGDESLQGHDAQTDHPLYLRVDHGLSYFVLTDVDSSRSEAVGTLSNYRRQLAGGKYHHEDEHITANLWAGYDRLSRKTVELPGRGVSGPYAISDDDLNIGIAGSERVDIIIRDRNQPSVVLRSETQYPGSDYTFDPFSGQLIFKRAIPSVDEFGNPISIRVSYELEEEHGSRFWTWGLDAQFRYHPQWTFGFAHAQDHNPEGMYRLSGLNVAFKPTPYSDLRLEWARSQQEQLGLDDSIPVGTGQAWRLDGHHEVGPWSSHVLYQEGSLAFYSPSYIDSINDWRLFRTWHQFSLDERQSIRIGASYQRRKSLDHQRGLADLAYLRDLDDHKNMYGELGLHYAEEAGIEASQEEAFDSCWTPDYHDHDRPTFAGVSGLGRWPYSCYQPLSARHSRALRGRLGWRHFGVQDLHAYLEAERELSHFGYAAAVGGDYRLSDWLRAYARHEYIRNKQGIYGSDADAAQATLLGLDTQLWEGYKLFSEYRVQDVQNGVDGAWANGLRKTWLVRPGWHMNGAVEVLRSMRGQHEHSWAVSWGNEWRMAPHIQGYTKIDHRQDHNQHTWLLGAGLTQRLSRDWSMSLNEYLYHVHPKEWGLGNRLQQRLQLGMAYRDHGRNRWNALARYEWKIDHDQLHHDPEDRGNRDVHMLLVNAETHPSRPWWLTSRLGFKHVREKLFAERYHYNAYLVGGRVTYDILDRWDVGLLANQLWDREEKVYNVGLEVGYRAINNLWLSVGYNFSGFEEKDFADVDYTDKGFYFRVRYKF